MIEMLIGQWIGGLNGTLVGNVYAEFIGNGETVSASVHANIDGDVLNLVGELSIDDNAVFGRLFLRSRASGHADVKEITEQTNNSATSSNESNQLPVDEYADLRIDRLSPDYVSGRWIGSGGDRGVFQLTPANTARSTPSAPQPIKPLQIVNKKTDIPKLRLSRADLNDLVAAMKRSIPTQNDVIVAYSPGEQENEIVQLSHDFFNRDDLPPILSSLRLNLDDDTQGLRKSIQLTLSERGSSLLVSAPDEVWVNGVNIQLNQEINRRISGFSKLFQRHGLNFNGFVLLLAIGLSPELNTMDRIVFLGIVVFAILVFKEFHSRISSVRILPRADTPAPTKLNFGEVITAISGGIGTAAIIGLYKFLSDGGLEKIGNWLSSLLVTAG